MVIVALKTTRNHLLATLLSPLLHKDTLVLLIQNGIGSEPELQKQFPDLYLAAGLAFICSSKTEPGRVNHQCYGSINIGNYSCKDTRIMDQLIADFNQAGVKAVEVEYREARWKKAVWNMPLPRRIRWVILCLVWKCSKHNSNFWMCPILKIKSGCVFRHIHFCNPYIY